MIAKTVRVLSEPSRKLSFEFVKVNIYCELSFESYRDVFAKLPKVPRRSGQSESAF